LIEIERRKERITRTGHGVVDVGDELGVAEGVQRGLEVVLVGENLTRQEGNERSVPLLDRGDDLPEELAETLRELKKSRG
jgi:hypothetical protein